MRILLLDIETAPALAYVWSLYDDAIPIQRLVKPGYTLCWSAKWYGTDKIMFDSIQNSTPRQVAKGIWNLLNEADVVVHYNGKRFDVPQLNRDFISIGLNPPSPYHQIDLYPVVKKSFRFPSYKLQYVVQALGLGAKIDHDGFELWVACMEGNNKAWKKMEEYNKGDVTLVEALYDKVKPWIPNHPNHGLYIDAVDPVCPSCGSRRLIKRGYRFTRSFKYRRFQCNNCYSWSSARSPEERNKNLLA